MEMRMKGKGKVGLWGAMLLGLLSAVAAQTAAPPLAKDNEKQESKAAPKSGDEFVIGADDILAINVWREPEMSRVVPVRPDGKISLPLLGEFEAAGSTARQLEAKILKALAEIVQNPQVTVIVQEIRSRKFSISGEVNRPGAYPITGTLTVLDAVAMAGGLRDFANPKKMYILRPKEGGVVTRINVNYKDALEGKDLIPLLPGDKIIVP
jgi:polysaccharide export outer membrane protein